MEDREGWHGKPLPAEMAERAIAELGGERHLIVRGPRARRRAAAAGARPGAEVEPAPSTSSGDKVATRKAYGDALAALGARGPTSSRSTAR